MDSEDLKPLRRFWLFIALVSVGQLLWLAQELFGDFA